MIFGDANRVGIWIGKEAAWGDDPTTHHIPMTQLRYTGETLGLKKKTVTSNTIRQDRMTDSIALLGGEISGDIKFEAAFASQNTILECLLGNNFTPVAIAAANITVDAAAKTFTRGAGSFIADGVKVGQYYRFGGYVANGDDAIYKVTVVTALVVTVADPLNTLVNEAGTGNETVKGGSLINGVLAQSLAIEKRFTDTGDFICYNGCRVDSLDLTLKSMAVIEGQLTIMGKQDFTPGVTCSSADTAAAVNTIMSASANVTDIQIDGVAIAAGVETLKLSIKNNLRKQEVVGSQYAGGIGYGRLDVSGDLTIFFNDLTLYNKMKNHAAFALSFRMTDVDGNTIVVQLPRLRLLDGSPSAASGNSDVMVPLTFGAERDATANAMIQVDSIAA